LLLLCRMPGVCSHGMQPWRGATAVHGCFIGCSGLVLAAPRRVHVRCVAWAVACAVVCVNGLSPVTSHARPTFPCPAGITKPAIRRLARRGGVKRISGLIYEETRGVLKVRDNSGISSINSSNQRRCMLVALPCYPGAQRWQTPSVVLCSREHMIRASIHIQRKHGCRWYTHKRTAAMRTGTHGSADGTICWWL
jgi:hypothetical protein